MATCRLDFYPISRMLNFIWSNHKERVSWKNNSAKRKLFETSHEIETEIFTSESRKSTSSVKTNLEDIFPLIKKRKRENEDCFPPVEFRLGGKPEKKRDNIEEKFMEALPLFVFCKRFYRKCNWQNTRWSEMIWIAVVRFLRQSLASNVDD